MKPLCPLTRLGTLHATKARRGCRAHVVIRVSGQVLDEGGKVGLIFIKLPIGTLDQFYITLTKI